MGANSKLVQQAYDAFDQADIATVIGLLDETVEWTSPRVLPHGGEFSGPAQVGKFFEGIGANWDSLVLDIESVNDVGPSQVVGVVRASGMQKDGTARQYGAAHVFEVNNGKITRFREYVDL
jgi:ketosteroid isomerase-like protein